MSILCTPIVSNVIMFKWQVHEVHLVEVAHYKFNGGVAYGYYYCSYRLVVSIEITD